MAKLSTVESLRTRLSKQDMGPINSAIDRALESATLQLAELLGTGFERQEHKDLFWVSSRERPFTGDYAELSLRNGFLQPGSVSVQLSASLGDLSEGPMVDPTTLFLDKKSGRVLLTTGSILYRGQVSDEVFLRVTYTAGFEDVGGVLQDVPPWLTELAEVVAAKLYNGSCTSQEKGNEACLLEVWRMAERHVRFHPTAFKPLL